MSKRSRNAFQRVFSSHKFNSSTSSIGLAYESFVPHEFNAGHKEQGKTMVLTHGILGSKRNWRTPANLLAKTQPGIKVLTVDHRGHGNSHGPTLKARSNTVDACAMDLEDTILGDREGEEKGGNDVDILSGHSFGGKVVLQLLKRRLERGLPLPEHTWVLDSLPCEYDDTSVSENTQESVGAIFDNLREVQVPFPNAKFAVDELIAKGISLPIAQWLTSNVRHHDTQEHGNRIEMNMTWGFDLDVATELFNDFVQLDMWDFVKNFDGADQTKNGNDAHLHFVRAGRNPLWTDGQLKMFRDVTDKNRFVQLHTMPHVGHWLHVEDVQGLVNLLTKEL